MFHVVHFNYVTLPRLKIFPIPTDSVAFNVGGISSLSRNLMSSFIVGCQSILRDDRYDNEDNREKSAARLQYSSICFEILSESNCDVSVTACSETVTSTLAVAVFEVGPGFDDEEEEGGGRGRRRTATTTR